jgi:hypothetical protein
MRVLLVGITVCGLAISALLSQTKTTPSKARTATPWSTTVVLDDDLTGGHKDSKPSELAPDIRTQLSDNREAGTKFANAFALDHSCRGLKLLLDSRVDWPLPDGKYWLVNVRLGPKETLQESAIRVMRELSKAQAEHGPLPPSYVHIDNAWFNWTIDHFTSPGSSGSKDEFFGEGSDMSPESAAHRVCLFVKSDGAVFGGSGDVPAPKR